MEYKSGCSCTVVHSAVQYEANGRTRRALTKQAGKKLKLKVVMLLKNMYIDIMKVLSRICLECVNAKEEAESLGLNESNAKMNLSSSSRHGNTITMAVRNVSLCRGMIIIMCRYAS